MLKYIFVLLLSSFFLSVQAQINDSKESEVKHVRGIQYSSKEDAVIAMQQKKVPFLSGTSVSCDAAGAFMALAANYGQWEGALRLHIRESFFPLIEAGWGVSDHTDETSEISYRTSAPFFRLGCDYNFMKNKKSRNRIFGGLRYGFTSFKYDVEGPDIVDPVYGTHTPFSFKDVSSNAQWMEVVFGLETKIWRFLHLGWSFRYKFLLHDKKSFLENSWYIPGYGKRESTALGGTFNIVFDI